MTGTSQPTILLVEDEPLVRMVAADFLDLAGFSVEPTATAAEALGRLGRDPGQFDAAVVDLGLPDRRGDSLAQEMRELSPALPILIASGFVDPETRSRFAADQKTGFIAKPFSGSQVVDALRRLGVQVPADGA